MARVTLENVTKRFGNVTAAEDFSLEIGDKELVVIVGPSSSAAYTKA